MPAVLQELHRPAQPKQTPTSEPLSERELEVLRLLARGMSNQEIADTLVVGRFCAPGCRKTFLADPRQAERLRPGRDRAPDRVRRPARAGAAAQAATTPGVVA